MTDKEDDPFVRCPLYGFPRRRRRVTKRYTVRSARTARERENLRRLEAIVKKYANR